MNVRSQLSRWLAIGACMALLAACTHSRVVRRDYDSPRSRPASMASSRAAPESLPRDGVHVVRRGETLYGISFRYGLRYQDVAAWNGISDPYIIEIGQRLRLRPGSMVATRPPARRPTGAPPAVTARPPSRPPVTGAPSTTRRLRLGADADRHASECLMLTSSPEPTRPAPE